MVRAVRLETTPSGSYMNASQGLFINTTTVATAVGLTTNSAENTSHLWVAPLALLTMMALWQLAQLHKSKQ